jgi:hypothetical protein
MPPRSYLIPLPLPLPLHNVSIGTSLPLPLPTSRVIAPLPNTFSKQRRPFFPNIPRLFNNHEMNSTVNGVKVARMSLYVCLVYADI